MTIISIYHYVRYTLYNAFTSYQIFAATPHARDDGQEERRDDGAAPGTAAAAATAS